MLSMHSVDMTKAKDLCSTRGLPRNQVTNNKQPFQELIHLSQILGGSLFFPGQSVRSSAQLCKMFLEQQVGDNMIWDPFLVACVLCVLPWISKEVPFRAWMGVVIVKLG